MTVRSPICADGTETAFPFTRISVCAAWLAAVWEVVVPVMVLVGWVSRSIIVSRDLKRRVVDQQQGSWGLHPCPCRHLQSQALGVWRTQGWKEPRLEM